jgi:transposase
MMKKGTELAAGVDVSALTLHVALEGHDDVHEFDNDTKGIEALLRWLRRGRRRVRVVVEVTGLYHLDLALALDKQHLVRVSVVNPRATKSFQAAANIRAKTDRVDARALCEYAKRMEFTEWTAPKHVDLELRARVRHVEQLTKDETRLKNRCHALDAAAATPGYVREQTAQQLAFVQHQIEAAKRALTAFVSQHAAFQAGVVRLTTIPGIGEWTAQRLIAAFLLLDPEMTSKQLTAWAGLDPRPRQSGTSLDGKRSISKRGSSHVRAALYMPALSASRHNEPLRRLHERVTRTKPEKVGLTAVMRKLLVISWAMHRNETNWNADLAAPRATETPKAA